LCQHTALRNKRPRHCHRTVARTCALPYRTARYLTPRGLPLRIVVTTSLPSAHARTAFCAAHNSRHRAASSRTALTPRTTIRTVLFCARLPPTSALLWCTGHTRLRVPLATYATRLTARARAAPVAATMARVTTAAFGRRAWRDACRRARAVGRRHVKQRGHSAVQRVAAAAPCRRAKTSAWRCSRAGTAISGTLYRATLRTFCRQRSPLRLL